MKAGNGTFKLLIILLIHEVQDARILGLLPLWIGSHHRFHQPVMRALAQAGHQVKVYSPFPLASPTANYTEVILTNITTEGEILENWFQELAKLPHWKCMDSLMLLSNLMFHEFFEDKEIKFLLKSKDTFDIIITEALLYQEHTLIFGHVFKAPVIVLNAFYAFPYLNYNAGNSVPISFIPDLCLPYSDKMKFRERLLSTFSTFRSLSNHYNYYLPQLEDKMRRLFHEMPPLLQMINNISLVFTNSHMTSDYPQPLTSNIVPIGGIHITDQQLLPQGIKRFMQEATEGVILFSLGTCIEDKHYGKEYFDMYINVFKRLPQRVLWKTNKEEIEGLPYNVMTMKWIPQIAVLAQENCVLFITHGGLHSQQEAIYFGVPVVAIPHFIDQYRNVRYFLEQGVGVQLELMNMSEETISASIHTVINDSRYKKNMKRLSSIFRDRPLSPAESVVYWTEYVLRHHGAAHLRPTSNHLFWYQRILLDVVGVVFVLSLIVVGIVHLTVKVMIRIKRVRVNIAQTTHKKRNK